MKRRIVILILLLILGAIVNVAVAWGLVSANGIGRGHAVTFVYYTADRAVTAGYRKTIGYISFSHTETTPLRMGYSMMIPYNHRMVDSLEEALPRANRTADGQPLRDYFCRVGLPFYSLDASDSRYHLDISDQVQDAEFILFGSGVRPRRHVYFPVKPSFPGFIINTLFYAALLWLLFLAPFAARRMLRRRRGLCEKCAYPVGVSPVCTECGAAVRPKANA